MTGEPQSLALYDQDCGFCKWSLDKILAWDRSKRLRAVAIQSEEGEQLLAGVDPQLRLDSWHLVSDGKVFSAGAAAEPLARLLPWGVGYQNSCPPRARCRFAGGTDFWHPTRQPVAQHNDLKLPLTTAAGEHADNPKEPIQHTHQHDAQSEPARPGSPTRRPDRNRISFYPTGP